jgi:hypothetical protein
MGPVTVDAIVAELSGATLRGAVQMPNNAGIGLVFANGRVLSVRMGFLHSEHESEGILEVVRRSLTREAAALSTLDGFDMEVGCSTPETRAAAGRAILTEDFGLEPPALSFLPERTVAEDEGHLDADHARKRDIAQREIERTTPDV